LPKLNFEDCVFINCPFDSEYEQILHSLLFCVFYFGLTPRIATERADSGENRLSKIQELVSGSKYSIHDLSRCQAAQAGEHYRMNMPFELGLDHGAKQYGSATLRTKKMLILEEKSYRYQAALSDLAGHDIAAHAGDYTKAIRKVRNWLREVTRKPVAGASKIEGNFLLFKEWRLEHQLAKGFSFKDIQDYSTSELLVEMREWFETEGPT
jgi:hypothetical protein